MGLVSGAGSELGRDVASRASPWRTRSLGLSPDGMTLAAGNVDGTVSICGTGHRQESRQPAAVDRDDSRGGLLTRWHQTGMLQHGFTNPHLGPGDSSLALNAGRSSGPRHRAGVFSRRTGLGIRRRGSDRAALGHGKLAGECRPARAQGRGSCCDLFPRRRAGGVDGRSATEASSSGMSRKKRAAPSFTARFPPSPAWPLPRTVAPLSPVMNTAP